MQPSSFDTVAFGCRLRRAAALAVALAAAVRAGADGGGSGPSLASRRGCVDLVADCGAAGDGVTDDTPAFAKCQAMVSASATESGKAHDATAGTSHGGSGALGCVTVPPTRFACVNVAINTSNVDWRVSAGATFLPPPRMARCEPMFAVGGAAASGAPAAGVSNVRFSGTEGRFTVDISKPRLSPWNVRGFMIVGDVSDFVLANAVIRMADPLRDPSITTPASKSGIEFGNDGGRNPRRCLVANVTSTGGSYGYGMIQTQSVQDSVFENLDGQGGSTLRLETGVGKPGAFVGNITARTVICRDGYNAAYILPHQQHNGRVALSDLQSYGCLTAVTIGAGYADPIRHPGEAPGSYSNDSTVTGLLAVYGTGAQAEVNVSNKPSCTACRHTWPTPGSKWDPTNVTGLNYRVVVTGVVARGFPAPANRTACVAWDRFVNGKEQLCPYYRHNGTAAGAGTAPAALAAHAVDEERAGGPVRRKVSTFGIDTVWVSASDGDDARSGATQADAVRTLARGLEICAAAGKRGDTGSNSSAPCARVRVRGALRLNATVSVGAGLEGVTVTGWPDEPAPTLLGSVEATLTPKDLPLAASGGQAPGGDNVRSSGGTTHRRHQRHQRQRAPAAQRDPPGVVSVTLPAATPAAAALRRLPATIHVGGVARSAVRTPMLRWERPLSPSKGALENRLGFVYSEGDVGPGWDVGAASDWTVSVHHSWVKGFHRVASVDRGNRTITFTRPAMFAFGDYVYCSDRRYYIENVRELPLTPGSWRCVGCGAEGSSDDVVLEYLPTEAETAATGPGGAVTVAIPAVEQMIAISARGATLSGVVLAEAAGPTCRTTPCDADLASMASGAVAVQPVGAAASTDAFNVSVVNVTLARVGGAGVRATRAPGLLVSRVAVLDAGAGGVFVSECVGARVNNSIIRGFGIRHRAGPGVQLTTSPASRADHNDISQGSYNGLTGGGQNDAGAGTAFDFNLVHGNGWAGEDAICDYGGIHLGTTGSVRPVRVANNVFWNITAYHNGGSGIYLDVSSTAVQVEMNLVHSTAYAPLEWHINPGVPPAAGTAPTRFVNNVLVSSGQNAFYASKGGDVIYWDGLTPSVFERNVVVVNATGAPSVATFFSGVPCARDFPANASASCTPDYADNFARANFTRNVWWNSSGAGLTPTFPGGACGGGGGGGAGAKARGCLSFASWQRRGFDEGSIVADPKLTSDFAVTSPAALALGIVPLTAVAEAGPDWSL